MSGFENLDSVSLWIGRYESAKMRKMYLRHLQAYCEFHEKDPNELIQIKRTQNEPVAEKMLDRFVLEWDKTDSVKVNAVAAIRSFYVANYADLSKRAGSGAKYRRIKPIRNPDQAQLADMCVGRNIRDIALINVISSGGFRSETLMLLNWSHVSEIESWNGTDPIHVCARGKELKGKGYGKYKGLEQHAFLVPNAIRMLLKYRAWRESRGEPIGPDSPLFATVDGRLRRLATRQFRKILDRACANKPYSFSPHDLRRFTQTQLEYARIQPNWIRKMLGKKIGGEDEPYSQPKIDQLREAFRGAIPHLTLAGPGLSVEPLSLKKKRQTLFDAMSHILKNKPDRLRIFENSLKMVGTERELSDLCGAWGLHLVGESVSVDSPL